MTVRGNSNQKGRGKNEREHHRSKEAGRKEVSVQLGETV
jgi:hypothetical protein